MEINIPAIVVEVTNAFMAYERALSVNDVDTLDAYFWNSPITLRYGPDGTCRGMKRFHRSAAVGTSKASTASFEIP